MPDILNARGWEQLEEYDEVTGEGSGREATKRRRNRTERQEERN